MRGRDRRERAVYLLGGRAMSRFPVDRYHQHEFAGPMPALLTHAAKSLRVDRGELQGPRVSPAAPCEDVGT